MCMLSQPRSVHLFYSSRLYKCAKDCHDEAPTQGFPSPDSTVIELSTSIFQVISPAAIMSGVLNLCASVALFLSQLALAAPPIKERCMLQSLSIRTSC